VRSQTLSTKARKIVKVAGKYEAIAYTHSSEKLRTLFELATGPDSKDRHLMLAFENALLERKDKEWIRLTSLTHRLELAKQWFDASGGYMCLGEEPNVIY
jgi:hypothetical protein